MRKLNWPDCSNVRDLGGLPAADGEVQVGRLVRSDNLDQLTPAGLAAIEGYGITRFVDLRSGWECEKYPSPYGADPRWRNLPLWEPADEDVSGFDLYEQYRILIDDFAARVAPAVAAIADAPPGCVVVNCHAGMDRTGVVIALTLDLIGVPRDLVATDYEISGQSGDLVRRLLSHIHQQYGGTHDYLLGAGMTAGQVGGLRSRLLG